MARKKAPEPHANHERWLVSYADFITLLFAFFVVMFATSKTDQKRKEAVQKAFVAAFESFGLYPGAGGTSMTPNINPTSGDGDEPEFEYSRSNSLVNKIDPKDPNPASRNQPPPLDAPTTGTGIGEGQFEKAPGDSRDPVLATDKPPAQEWFNVSIGTEGSDQIRNFMAQLQRLLGGDVSDGRIAIREKKPGVVISMAGSLTFAKDATDLDARGEETLARLARALIALDKSGVVMRVEGHAASAVAEDAASYAASLNTANARAAAVVAYLISQFDFSPANLLSVGYGQWRAAPQGPITPATTPDRVDIVILNDDYSRMERQGRLLNIEWRGVNDLLNR